MKDLDDLDHWNRQGSKPKETGVYEVRPSFLRPVLYSYWNGKHWGETAATPETAEQSLVFPGKSQKHLWGDRVR